MSGVPWETPTAGSAPVKIIWPQANLLIPWLRDCRCERAERYEQHREKKGKFTNRLRTSSKIVPAHYHTFIQLNLNQVMLGTASSLHSPQRVPEGRRRQSLLPYGKHHCLKVRTSGAYHTAQVGQRKITNTRGWGEHYAKTTQRLVGVKSDRLRVV